jgi:DNA end-binding protein Ku
MMKLRYSEEVLSPSELPAPAARPLVQKELRMAEELIGALEGKFDPSEFRDEYRERLTEFIEAKAKGKHPRLPKISERRTVGSLGQQLEKSLAAMKRGREKKVA